MQRWEMRFDRPISLVRSSNEDFGACEWFQVEQREQFHLIQEPFKGGGNCQLAGAACQYDTFTFFQSSTGPALKSALLPPRGLLHEELGSGDGGGSHASHGHPV